MMPISTVIMDKWTLLMAEQHVYQSERVQVLTRLKKAIDIYMRQLDLENIDTSTCCWL